MTEDRWNEIKTMVKKQFDLEDEGTEDLMVPTADGPTQQGTAEYVMFEGPMGRMKLQFQTKPKLEDKQYHYSKRAGDTARVEYTFSEDEVVHTFKAYKWKDIDEEWEEIDAKQFDS